MSAANPLTSSSEPLSEPSERASASESSSESAGAFRHRPRPPPRGVRATRPHLPVVARSYALVLVSPSKSDDCGASSRAGSPLRAASWVTTSSPCSGDAGAFSEDSMATPPPFLAQARLARARETPYTFCDGLSSFV